MENKVCFEYRHPYLGISWYTFKWLLGYITFPIYFICLMIGALWEKYLEPIAGGTPCKCWHIIKTTREKMKKEKENV